MLFKKKEPEENIEKYKQKQKGRELDLESLREKRKTLEEQKQYRSAIEEEKKKIKELKPKPKFQKFGESVKEGVGKTTQMFQKEGSAVGKTLHQVVGDTGKKKPRFPSVFSGGANLGIDSPSYFDKGLRNSYFDIGVPKMGSYFEKPKEGVKKIKPKKRKKRRR